MIVAMNTKPRRMSKKLRAQAIAEYRVLVDAAEQAAMATIKADAVAARRRDAWNDLVDRIRKMKQHIPDLAGGKV